MLIYPNPESALNEEAGKLLLEHYDDYSRHARLITSIHAQRPSSSIDDTITDSQYESQSKKRPHEKVAISAPPTVDKKKKDKKKALRRL